MSDFDFLEQQANDSGSKRAVRAKDQRGAALTHCLKTLHSETWVLETERIEIEWT
jgi:hypothetical protein